MRELIYALRFTGQATPSSPDGQVLAAATTAPSSAITTTMAATGLTGQIEAIAGDVATFASEVTFTDEGVFLESGTIDFGPGDRVRFTTVGHGVLGPSADPARQHGAVLWRVVGGEGQFAGASGLITSNFFVGADLAVTDHHFGVLLLPAPAAGAGQPGDPAAASPPRLA